MLQPVYQPRPDDVERKLVTLFPDETERASANAMLESYGTEDWHREPDRVRLAILYLTGGNLEQVAQHVELAATDYRDVIAAAEYPSVASLGPGVEAGSYEYWAAVTADAKRYRTWMSA